MKRAIVILFTLVAARVCAQSLVVDAGPFHQYCDTTTVALGGSPTASGGTPPYSYQWAPITPLTTYTASNPVATVSATTTFTVTVRDGAGTTLKDTVTIRIYNYSISAGADTTIKEGQTITLHGSAPGATNVYWQPSASGMYNPSTLTPNAFPHTTTTYTLSALYPGGCAMYDYLTITVIPNTDLWFFNTFTPNGDQVNDYFYIGNIEKYPDNVLEIYNRYGQKIFTQTSYQNLWDGKYLNQELPSGTYFYILDTKSDKGGKYHGSVTIIR